MNIPQLNMAVSSITSWRAKARFFQQRLGTLLRNLGIPLGTTAKLIFHPDYAVSPRDARARHAFDVRRSSKIIEQLYRTGVLSPSQVMTPGPVRNEDLLLVHTPHYLEEITQPGRLAELLFLPRDPLRDNSLLSNFLIQSGGTVLAAQRAVLERNTVINLGGGFHHAHRDRAEGFCAINDVAIAIRLLQKQKRVEQVLVIDLDYHPGNGTALIFSEDERVFTLSIHGQSWSRVEGKNNNLDVELPPGTKDAPYLSTLRRSLALVLSRFSPQLAFYLAGADVHEEDSLGDFAITEEGLLERDLYVWQTLKDAGIPQAILLAGGYSPLAWALQYNFIFSILTGMRIQPIYRPTNIEAHFRRVKGRLSSAELRQGHPHPAPEDWLSTGGRASTTLFMEQYTAEGMKLVLERYGFLDLLREKGFDQLQVSIQAEDPERQIARIHDTTQDPDHLLVELVARFRTLVMPLQAVQEGANECYRLLSIEWLLMQNPRQTFSLDRQHLPGQEHPGLGLGRWMLELLRMMSERLNCDGLMNIPQHYHNAFLYSKRMLFFAPADQGYWEALKRDLGHLPLAEASTAVEQGKLRNIDTGEIVHWEGKPQIMPTTASLNAYFARISYLQAVRGARERFHFKLAL